MKNLLISVTLLAGVSAGISLWLAGAQQTGSPAPAAPSHCVRISFGWRDTVPRRWDGRAGIHGGRLARLDSWRFGPNDSISGASWRASSGPSLAPANPVWPGAACALEDDSRLYQDRHPAPVVGVLAYMDGPASARLAVETPLGSFEVAPAELQFGRSATLLDGHARAELVPAGGPVDPESPEQDYPALAAGRDGALWLAYLSYAAARHEDRILLVEWRDGRWSAPRDVAGAGNFHRPQVAVDGRGRVWVMWAALVAKAGGEDWDLFARVLDSGRWSETLRIAGAAGGDTQPALAAAPDGNLWLAWQGNRKGNWDIFVSRLEGDNWLAAEALSSGAENEWAPSIAAGGDGRVVVAYDSHRRGSYNVYMRLFSAGRWEPEIEVASGEDYEANAAVTIDGAGRVWVAWDNGGPAWGLDSACNGLYKHRRIDVRAWVDGGWQAPLVNPMRDLPPPMTRFVSLPRPALDAAGRLWLFFRHWTNRRVYEFYAIRLTRDGWSEPVPLPHSAGREHQKIATALAADGRIWAAWSTDGSQPRTARPRHYQVLAAALPGEASGVDEPPLMRATPPLNITVAMPAEPARHTAVAGGRKLNVYWGDLHRHTDVSSHRFTDGSIEDTYRYGADVAKLDFLAPTDHVSTGAPTTDNIQGDDYHWWRAQKAADLHFLAGVFTPIYAYERSMLSPGGHRNLLYLRRGATPIPGNNKDPKDNDPAWLWERLRGQEVIATPHTPGDVMQPLITWKDTKPDFEPLVEIYQGLRSSYEYRGAPPDGRLGGTQTGEPGHFFQDALAKGLRYGVQASSDHLATHINYTGVYAEDPSREALFAAMKARRTFAASDKIIVDFRMGGHWMGEELRAPAPPAEVQVIGTAPLRRVELVRNGRVIHTVEPGLARAAFRFRDAQPPPGEAYYYVRATQADGNMAWSSPIWVVR